MKTLEELALKAGFRVIPQAAPGVNWIYTGSASGRCSEALERFAALVAAECAREAQAMAVSDHDEAADGYSMDHWNQCCESVAIRLRAAFPMPKG